ncbi:MAG: ABC transporter substrate-binding protein, partial [Chloroflexota bacterium]|nr:ABC transporter substrate-binding protein [Chloroflexota bacterium]
MTYVVDGTSSKRFYRSNVGTVLVGILFLCAIALAACGGGPTTSNTTAKGGSISVGLVSDPQTLDPLKSVTLYDTDVMANMYDSLFRYDAQNVIHPLLVSSYSYTSPTVLNLTLHTGITFQDGTPFNADAVLFNLNRFINNKASPRYSDVVSIASVQKVSADQVQITLKQAYAPLLDKLSGQVGMMLSPAVVKKLGTKLGNAPINAGSGAFTFVEWVKGDHVLLKANPHYWQKDAAGNALPYLQSVRFRSITNTSVMYSNLQTNSIQIASTLGPSDVAQAKANPGLIYRQVPGPGFESLQINVSAPPFNNV